MARPPPSRAIFNADCACSTLLPPPVHPCYITLGDGGCTELFLPLLIFALTLFLILWRPRGVREVWFAAGGAVIMLATGFVGRVDIIELWAETGSVLAFLAGMLVVGFVADQAGVFAWLAYHTARLSGGSGVRLYVGLYVIGVFVTIWFSLDTTAVVLAPIVYSLVRTLGLPALPFVLATTYVANTASLLLPVSNLTNLIVWNRFDIPFWEYAGVMAVPAAAAIVVNLLLFLWMFRRDIPAHFSLAPLAEATEAEVAAGGEGPAAITHGNTTMSPRLTGNLIILAGILAGLAAAPFFGWELWVVAVVGGAVLAVVEIFSGQLRPHRLVSGISWDLLPFVFSLFLILRGVGKSGLTELAQAILVGNGAGHSFAELLTVAATTAIGANLINNLPMLLVAADGLTEPIISGQVDSGAIFAALLGANLGPNLTVIGSLATMLSLSIIGKKGLRVPGMLSLKVGLVTVPLLLLAAVFGLWISLKLF